MKKNMMLLWMLLGLSQYAPVNSAFAEDSFVDSFVPSTKEDISDLLAINKNLNAIDEEMDKESVKEEMDKKKEKEEKKKKHKIKHKVATAFHQYVQKPFRRYVVKPIKKVYAAAKKALSYLSHTISHWITGKNNVQTASRSSLLREDGQA